MNKLIKWLLILLVIGATAAATWILVLAWLHYGRLDRITP